MARTSRKRFAFYGRVSTEDHQDPQSSRAWQLRRGRQLIEPHGGEAIAEYFDVGQSRSLPWKRRPESARLLAEFPRRDRAFDAVVIGEPQRAFYGNQFGLMFPLFEHYGVELWVPEVGGRVDPGSEAQDLVMMLFGGMSKGERTRIRTRVKNAMAAQASTEGRFLGGRPPYGYRLADAGPHPNPDKRAMGVRLHVLEPDPVTAPVVARIFDEYVASRGLYAIAEGLTREGVLSPSAYDRARNRHRTGGGWGKSAIDAILRNPKYTGYMLWNRQRRDEVLIDIDDVAAGHESVMRWNGCDDWVKSAVPTHPPLISEELFEQASAQRLSRRTSPTPKKPRATERPYVLRGLLRCGYCARRMQGNWNHNQAHYRCLYPLEYALAKNVEHPRTVYLRENQVVPPLDAWLNRLFDRDHLDETCETLLGAQDERPGERTEAEAARRALADCDRRLARYRAAVEAGTDPVVVAEWIRQVTAERAAAEGALRVRPRSEALTVPLLREALRDIGDTLAVLEAADPVKKAALYGSLGLTLTYKPDQRIVFAEADLASRVRKVRVGEGTWPLPLPLPMIGALSYR